MTSLFCIDLCGRSMPHSASTKETAFSTRRVCHKSGSAAINGRQPAHQNLGQMRLPFSSQDPQDVNEMTRSRFKHVQTCCQNAKKHRYSYMPHGPCLMSGRQWSMRATVTLQEAKHGSLLKRHRGLSTSHDADRMVSKWVIISYYNQLINGVY